VVSVSLLSTAVHACCHIACASKTLEHHPHGFTDCRGAVPDTYKILRDEGTAAPPDLDLTGRLCALPCP
jgi:hypothetical protein